MSKKKTVIRIGDTVKIINSRFIKRVGYPLIWTDLLDEVYESDLLKKVYKLITTDSLENPKPIEDSALALDNNKSLWISTLDDPTIYNQTKADLARIIAKRWVEDRNFGGNERQIIYYKTNKMDDFKSDFIIIKSDDEIPDYSGYKLEVIGKKIAKTGTRFPSSGGYDSYTGEYWEEPGGLDDCKTHVLLNTCVGWIEEIDVELVKRAKEK